GGTCLAAVDRRLPDGFAPGHRDLELLWLERDAPAVPAPLLRVHPPEGTTARLVGFGLGGENGTGRRYKQEADATVTHCDGCAEPGYVQLDGSGGAGATCHGDSGGPTFVWSEGVESLASVHTMSDCDHQSIDTAVADELAWIEGALVGTFLA